ncbi:MAG: two-component regulator propeller domain-containing protein, partial [Segetibacter sp.]
DFKRAQIHNLKNDKKDPSSISYNDILSIKKDKTNGIWIGTDGGGISYYNERLNNFISFTNSNLPENIEIGQVRSIVTNKAGQIWAGTSNNGLTLLDKKKGKDITFKFKSYNASSSNVNRIVSLFADDKGDLWVGTQGNGLLLFDTNKKKLIKHFYPGSKLFNIPDYTIWCIFPKSPSQVWIGTQNAGLCVIDKVKGLVKSYAYKLNSPNSIRDNNVRTITTIDDNTLCLGYEKKGIEFFDTKKEVFRPFKNDSLSNFFQNEPTIKSIFYSKPTIWIGTQSKGLLAVNRFTGLVTHLSEKDGLPNNTVYGILQDGQANVWISTNKGICRFDPGTNPDKVTPSGFINFTAADGLQSNEFNTGAYCKGMDGSIYFGGISGLTSFNPDKFTGSQESPDVVFTNILIDNEPLVDDTLPAYNKTLALSYKAKSIAFNFVAIDYSLSHQQHYYYRLEGYDKDWVQAGDRSYAQYTNLPPQHYVFKVKASRYKSSVSDAVSSLSIIIKPPFWITWWFITLSVIFSLFILYTIYRYRIHQLLQVQKVRNHIAADLHDDIGSSLTNISILSELTKQNLPQPEAAKAFVERIIEEVNSSSQALDDIIWSVKAKDNSLEDLLARMRRYAAELFDAGQVNYELGFDEELSHLKLQMEQRRDLYLIFKEAMNNICKHAAASYVTVYIKREDHKLLIEIKDDGKGFDTKGETHRNGLKNIEARTKKWKGNVFIESAQDKGTVVKVSLPIK